MIKAQKVSYWISTIWTFFGMLSGVIFHLIHMPDAVKSFQHLGYPEYLLTFLGVAKVLSALFSHLYMKDSFGETFPAVLTLVLVLTSWYVRPDDKKI